MASVKYIMRGKTNMIYIRFSNGANFDITTKTGIILNIKFWDKKREMIRNVLDVPNRDIINHNLLSLKSYILNEYNNDYMNGEVFDLSWLKSKLNTFFNRPTDNNHKHLIFLYNFTQWWMDNKADKYKLNVNKLMDRRAKSKYANSCKFINEYQEYRNISIKFKELNSELIDDYSLFLSDVKGFAQSSIKLHISILKFFCLRAEEENINVNKGYKSKVFLKSKKEYKEPYLNEDEITLIYNFQTDVRELIIARDNFVIGLRTGLRISDFLTRLNIENIKDDFIEIKTKKTNTNIAIPLHWQVKAILKRYNGNLPPKIAENTFNQKIKIIAKKIGLNQKLEGGILMINDKGEKRKVFGTFEKWQLITSHICRRSFATNLIGKVPNQVIMHVAGWSNEKQMFAYNKMTNRESAEELRLYWEKEK